MTQKLRYKVLLRERYGTNNRLNTTGKWYSKGSYATREEAEKARLKLAKERPTAHTKISKYVL